MCIVSSRPISPRKLISPSLTDWCGVSGHTSFVAPVRQLLTSTSTKMVCRQEMEVALREEKSQKAIAKDRPEMCRGTTQAVREGRAIDMQARGILLRI